MWTALSLLTLAAVVWLGLRVRRLDRRLEALSDRLVDWRLSLARNQDELLRELGRLGGGVPASAGEPPGRGAAAPEGDLIQLRPTRRGSG